MKNLLKALPKIIDNNETFDAVASPDTLSLRLMEADLSRDIVSFTQSFGRDDVDLQRMLSRVDINDDIEDLIFVLRRSDKKQWNEVADFIENELSKIENINLVDKKMPAILWATTIYAFMKNADRAHAGTKTFVDPMEVLSIQYFKSLANNEEQPLININTIRSQVVNIFKDTK